MGAFRNNIELSPKSAEPIGDPPAHLASEAAAAWYELIFNAPAGVLTGSDRWAVEALCQLIAKSRRERLAGGESWLLLRFLAELGATPASYN